MATGNKTCGGTTTGKHPSTHANHAPLNTVLVLVCDTVAVCLQTGGTFEAIFPCFTGTTGSTAAETTTTSAAVTSTLAPPVNRSPG